MPSSFIPVLMTSESSSKALITCGYRRRICEQFCELSPPRRGASWASPRKMLAATRRPHLSKSLKTNASGKQPFQCSAPWQPKQPWLALRAAIVVFETCLRDIARVGSLPPRAPFFVVLLVLRYAPFPCYIENPASVLMAAIIREDPRWGLSSLGFAPQAPARRQPHLAALCCEANHF